MTAGGASSDEPPILEAQQALLLHALKRASGEPVSYAELRDAGVELPASVVAELELAGVPIERCNGGQGGGPRVLGVRLRESAAVAELLPEDTDGWTPVRVYRTASARNRLVLAAAGIGAAIVLMAVLVLAAPGGQGSHARSSRTLARRPSEPLAAHVSAPAPARVTTSATPAAPTTPVSPALADQLESQGHALVASGQYTSAIPILRRALAATGERQSACVQPDGTTCLTYAYALYDLGRALRLSGNSVAAVPILEARLQIDNQRSVVAAELQLAREHVG